jgi:hypothetical protein
VEMEGHKQLHVVANPETSPTKETVQPISPTTNVATSDQVNRVERLLTQLEAKSMAVVTYGYWNQPQVQAKKSNTWLIAAALGCIWLSTLALAIAYFSYKNSSQVAERGLAATPLSVPSLTATQAQKTAESMERLGQLLLTSSGRLNKVEAATEKSNHDLQQLKSKMNTERAKAVPTPPKAEPTESGANVATAVANPLGTPVANSVATLVVNPPIAAPSAGASPKNPNRVLSIKPTDAAIPHKAADGTIDYWLVARGAFKELAKVQPIAISADGIVVHNLEDGKNYTLTRQGEWRNSEW